MADRDTVDDIALRVIAFATGLKKRIAIQSVAGLADDAPVIVVSERIMARIKEIAGPPKGSS